MKCSNCGATNAEGNKFCIVCGTPLLTSQVAQQSRPTNWTRILIPLVGAFLAVCVCVSCLWVLLAFSKTSPSKTYDVEYEVIAGKGASISYNNEFGSMDHRELSEARWTMSFKAKSGDYLFVSAQSKVGVALCTINVDGVPFRMSTSNVSYATVTCSGRLP